MIDLLIERCTELQGGARMIDNVLTNTMLPNISRECLTRMMDAQALSHVRVTASDNEFQYAFD